MEYAVISDVHANLQALKAVLERIGDTKTYCLGDMIGYGAQPNEVIDLIRQKGITCIRGNHEDHLFEEPGSWTSKLLSRKNTRYLKELPQKIETAEALFVHGSPRSPTYEYLFPDETEKFEKNAKHTEKGIIFSGHTHIQMNINTAGKTWVNPGSVGQPRDERPMPGYVLVKDKRIRRYRIDYDIKKAVAAIRGNDMIPKEYKEKLVRRLFKGR